MTSTPRTRAVVTAAAVVFLTLMLSACGDPPAEQPGDGDSSMLPPGQIPDDTVVDVVVDDGDGTVETFTLRCGDAPLFGAGDAGARDVGAACAALEDHRDRLVELSDPQREPQMCTEIYGGPQEATIAGRVDGEDVDVTITRSNGCGISDWDALEPLLGPTA